MGSMLPEVRGTGPRVIVVGGGIVGCAVALEVHRRGCRVILVEQETPGSGASGAAAGMLAGLHEPSLPPEVRSFGRRSEEVFERFVQDLENLTGIGVGFDRGGMLVANRTDEEERTNRVLGSLLNFEGSSAELVCPQEALRIHPGISPTVLSWLWLPNQARVDAQRLAHALEPALRTSGVGVVRGRRVGRIEHARGRVRGIRFQDGLALPSDVVVLAAGAWGGLLQGLPRPLPVRPVKGEILRLLPPDPPPRCAVSTMDGCYAVPRSGGTVLVGSTMEESGFDNHTTHVARRSLRSRIGALIRGLSEACVVNHWSGLRPVSSDGLPILGPDPDLDGLVYATGHGRSGIFLAPLTALLVADFLVEGSSPIPWESFWIGRFPTAS